MHCLKMNIAVPLLNEDEFLHIYNADLNLSYKFSVVFSPFLVQRNQIHKLFFLENML